MYKRAEYQTIKNRLVEGRKFIQVVMGPRQVGKSTVVRQVLQDIDIPYQFYSADNVPATNTAWVSNCWEATRSLMSVKGYDSIILVIDEDNKRCINLISRFPFDEMENSRFINKEDLSRPPRVFECPLSTIRFS